MPHLNNLNYCSGCANFNDSCTCPPDPYTLPGNRLTTLEVEYLELAHNLLARVEAFDPEAVGLARKNLRSVLWSAAPQKRTHQGLIARTPPSFEDDAGW